MSIRNNKNATKHFKTVFYRNGYIHLLELHVNNISNYNLTTTGKKEERNGGREEGRKEKRKCEMNDPEKHNLNF